jgi:hypothetical protein
MGGQAAPPQPDADAAEPAVAGENQNADDTFDDAGDAEEVPETRTAAATDVDQPAGADAPPSEPVPRPRDPDPESQ